MLVSCVIGIGGDEDALQTLLKYSSAEKAEFGHGVLRVRQILI